MPLSRPMMIQELQDAITDAYTHGATPQDLVCIELTGRPDNAQDMTWAIGSAVYPTDILGKPYGSDPVTEPTTGRLMILADEIEEYHDGL